MKRIISISLLLIFLAGNSGFAMVTHYCGGMAMETQIVVGHTELHCGMSDMESGCETESSKENQFKKKPCCENEYQSLKVEDEFQAQVIGSSMSLEFVAAFFATFIGITYSFEADKTEYKNYSPPLIERDIPVLVQSFLI
ncbi:MAG TPA: hypothetical protein PKL31_00670 [Fulvivirga sp.]|nr:hypothetical protein [Fulvivirga sp.]